MDKTLNFIRNIRALTKGHTGEFEKECGVCRGYLARAEQSNIKRMNIDIALVMAKKLGYTVEDLSQADFLQQRRIAEIDKTIKTLTEEREQLA